MTILAHTLTRDGLGFAVRDPDLAIVGRVVEVSPDEPSDDPTAPPRRHGWQALWQPPVDLTTPIRDTPQAAALDLPGVDAIRMPDDGSGRTEHRVATELTITAGAVADMPMRLRLPIGEVTNTDTGITMTLLTSGGHLTLDTGNDWREVSLDAIVNAMLGVTRE